jgi:hypothetical protein
MAHEIEAAAADSAGAVFGRLPQHPLPLGAPCPNCATTLAGPWCHACGQSSEDFHRSLLRLAGEAMGGLIDIDSRLWRTLPRLCLRPAQLTREFLDGRRAPQIPPFRLFLIVVVLVFLVAGLGPASNTAIDLGQGGGTTKAGTVFHVVPMQGAKVDAWFIAHAKAAAKDPQRFENSLATWAQRMAILTLPMSALMLGAMFFWRRDVYMFDHLIFSMHSLSFQGLLVSALMLGAMVSDWVWWLILAAPAHLFVHLKGTYGLGVFGTLARMIVLFAGSLVGFMVIMSGLVLIGLYEVGA